MPEQLHWKQREALMQNALDHLANLPEYKLNLQYVRDIAMETQRLCEGYDKVLVGTAFESEHISEMVMLNGTKINEIAHDVGRIYYLHTEKGKVQCDGQETYIYGWIKVSKRTERPSEDDTSTAEDVQDT